MTTLADLPARARASYVCFALALAIALGSYQFVSPVRQALFFDLVGTGPEPLAKSLVIAVLVPVLLLYSALFSSLDEPKWFTLVVGGFFAVMYLFTAFVLHLSAGHPGAWLAWVLYYLTECRAIILMPMIWSIVNDVTSSEVAKTAYPLIFFLIQLGGIGGSFVAVHVKSLGGEVGLLLLQVVLLALIVTLTWCGCALLGPPGAAADPEQAPLLEGAAAAGGTSGAAAQPPSCTKARAGVFFQAVEGLWLLLSRPYVFMTFWVSYATLMPRTVLDYTNGVLVRRTWPERGQQIAFWGRMSLGQNIATAALTLVGTRPIVEAVGVGNALVVLPLVLLCCTLAVSVHTGLWVSVVACVAASVMAYGLNSPCKEMLYIRTSRDIKYKAKSWSEMYGNELMKLLGAQINLWVNNENDRCLPNCFHPTPTVFIVGLWVMLWLFIAVRVGREHQRLEAEDKIVK